MSLALPDELGQFQDELLPSCEETIVEADLLAKPGDQAAVAQARGAKLGLAQLRRAGLAFLKV
jgi:hypothetical protein